MRFAARLMKLGRALFPEAGENIREKAARECREIEEKAAMELRDDYHGARERILGLKPEVPVDITKLPYWSFWTVHHGDPEHDVVWLVTNGLAIRVLGKSGGFKSLGDLTGKTLSGNELDKLKRVELPAMKEFLELAGSKNLLDDILADTYDCALYQAMEEEVLENPESVEQLKSFLDNMKKAEAEAGWQGLPTWEICVDERVRLVDLWLKLFNPWKFNGVDEDTGHVVYHFRRER